MDEFHLYKGSLWLLLCWSHFTILLYIIYKKVYHGVLNYIIADDEEEEEELSIDELKDKVPTDNKVSLADKILQENNDKISAENNDKVPLENKVPLADKVPTENNVSVKDLNDIRDYFKSSGIDHLANPAVENIFDSSNFQGYLKSLGRDHFGSLLVIDVPLSDEFNGTPEYFKLSLPDINKLSSPERHKILLQLIRENLDIFEKDYGLSGYLEYKISADETNTGDMSFYLFQMINNVKKDFKDTVNTGLKKAMTIIENDNFLGALLNMVNSMNIVGSITMGDFQNKGEPVDNVGIEEMDDIKKEMALIAGGEEKTELEKEMDYFREPRNKSDHKS